MPSASSAPARKKSTKKSTSAKTTTRTSAKQATAKSAATRSRTASKSATGRTATARATTKAKAPSKARSKSPTKASSKAKTSRAATKPKRKQRGELNGPEEHLWRKYAKTRDPSIRNELMQIYLPVVNFIAERLLLTLPRSIDVDDLKSSGVFGLMDAIDGFDIERGIKFKTYCSTRVRGAILDELRSQDWVPRLVRLRAHQITRAQATLEARHGRAPTHYEMAAALNVDLDEYTAIMEEARAHSMHSLSDTWDDGSGDQSVEKVDIIKDRGAIDPAEVLNQEDVMRAIIRSLNRREKQIILMYYRDGLTMKQIGDVLELTESRVCQIHSNVIKKLKVHLETSHATLVI